MVTNTRPKTVRTRSLQPEKPRRNRVMNDPETRQRVLNTVYGLARAGFTQDEIAKALGVDGAALRNWTIEDHELLYAMQPEADASNMRVAGSLYRRAMGYDRIDRRVIEYHEDGVTPKHVEEVHTHVPPSDTAIIFWLKNRDKGNWRDVKQIEGDVSLNTDKPTIGPAEIAQAVLLALQQGLKAHKVIEHDDVS